MKKLLVLGIIVGMGWQSANAGNPDRKGEAGAPELNMNAYARSAGLWDLNVAGVKGLEAERLNPAGLGLTQGTEVNRFVYLMADGCWCQWCARWICYTFQKQCAGTVYQLTQLRRY
jgi:hypothetical protein